MAKKKSKNLRAFATVSVPKATPIMNDNEIYPAEMAVPELPSDEAGPLTAKTNVEIDPDFKRDYMFTKDHSIPKILNVYKKSQANIPSFLIPQQIRKYFIKGQSAQKNRFVPIKPLAQLTTLEKLEKYFLLVELNIDEDVIIDSLLQVPHYNFHDTLQYISLNQLVDDESSNSAIHQNQIKTDIRNNLIDNDENNMVDVANEDIMNNNIEIAYLYNKVLNGNVSIQDQKVDTNLNSNEALSQPLKSSKEWTLNYFIV
jgi:hypothetical protein